MICLKCSNETNIDLYCANQFDFTTEPYYLDTNEPIQLGENDYIQFAVKSNVNGKYYIRKILTQSDYNDDGLIQGALTPLETNLPPQKYVFDLGVYIANAGYWTYNQGTLTILPVVGKPIDIDPLPEVNIDGN